MFFGRSRLNMRVILSSLLVLPMVLFACLFFIFPKMIFGEPVQESSESQTSVSSSGEILVKDISTAGFPNISIYLNFKEGSQLGLLNLEKEDFSIMENNSEINDFIVEKVGEISEAIGIVLALDTSGSMKNEPIENAKTAASTFINEMRDIDKISIVGFSDTATVFSSFTSEKQVLKNSINEIEAYGETALFDGIVKGLEQFKSLDNIKHKYLIVLSDGTDTVSGADINSAIENAAAEKVTVYSVALISGEFNPSDLEKIAVSTNGELLTTANSDDLKTLYNKISEKIRNQYKITYKSLSRDSKQFNASISVQKLGLKDSFEISYENPFFALSGNSAVSSEQSSKAVTRIMIIDQWWIKLIIYILIFVSVTIFIYIVSTIMVPNRQDLKIRTDYYLYNISEQEEISSSEGKSRMRFLSRFSKIGSRQANKKGFSDLFEQKLRRAGINISGSRFVLIHISSVIVMTFVVFLVSRNFLATFCIVIFIIFMPFLFINFKTNQKVKKFNEQLPDTLQLIEGALKAGYSLNQSLVMVIKETKPPISEEFGITLNEIRMGLSEKAALENMAKRINSELFNWVVLAINIQREVGGNLAEIMDIIANTIREKERVLRQIKALTAEGKLSAYVLIGLPIILGVALSILNREYISVLFTTKIGFLMLFLAAVLMLAGIIWILRIVKIEY